jgi:hypothetical protein
MVIESINIEIRRLSPKNFGYNIAYNGINAGQGAFESEADASQAAISALTKYLFGASKK